MMIVLQLRWLEPPVFVPSSESSAVMSACSNYGHAYPVRIPVCAAYMHCIAEMPADDKFDLDGADRHSTVFFCQLQF